MKKWTAPVIEVQVFEANEYVAACWGVACDTKAATKLENQMHNNPSGGHTSSLCGVQSHQYVFTDANNVAIGMQEQKHPIWGTLTCTLYTDQSYTVRRDIANVDPGDVIYWTTQRNGNLYHHVGTVQASYPGNPNRS